jgi:elongation factor G
MSITEVASVRSFALIGHGGDGKTTLADSAVMAAGIANRLGSVEQGTSFMNYLPEEKHRRITISASICSFDHDGTHFNLLDAPGDANFAGELVGALEAVDLAVLVVSAADGIKVGTEKAWKLAEERGLAVAAVANKCDHDAADLDRTARALEEAFGVRVVKLHLPVGAGAGYKGFVDLVGRKAHLFGDDSGRAQVGEVPGELADAVGAARMSMMEAVAEGDDAMVEKYLEQGELSDEEIVATLRKGIRERKLVPLLSAAATRNVGGAELLATAARYFPNPAEGRARATRKDAGEETVVAEPGAPLRALVWKSVADRYTGMLSVLRVCSGTLRAEATITNARTGTRERVGKLLELRGEATVDAKEVGPGGIVAVAKLKDTRTGDTLCDDKHVAALVSAPPPRGVISFAIEAGNKGDEDKVFEALNRLVQEDWSLRLARDERTGEFLLTGLGQLHIEVTLEKLRRLFKVDVKLKPPKVPYLETITGRAQNVEGKLKKQSGGRGQFGVCYLSIEPGPRGSGVAFLDEIVGGAIPRNFIPAVEEGVRSTCERGVLAGYPLTDIKIHCIDGKYHDVDSSEQAFKMAGSLGIKAAVAQAKPTLLEPIMAVEIAVPDDHVGDIMGNLNGRRGRVSGVDTRGHTQMIRAQVPMSEMLTYASDLTSMTGGKGSFTMEFSHYEEMPAQLRERVIAAAHKDTQAED